MMKRCLCIIFIIFTLLISSGSAFAKDSTEPAVSKAQYIILDRKDFNKSVISAKGEARTSDPVTVSLRFTGPFEGLTQSIERKNAGAESTMRTTVTIINEGLLDDSVMGEKYLIELKKTDHGIWIIESAGKMVRCWKGRGHQDYSKKLCN
jgi:hypothetical protein